MRSFAFTKRSIGWIVAIAAGLAAVYAAGPTYRWGVVFGLWQPWNRPEGVSRAARYVSWVEDGTWFDCKVDLHRNVDVCKAWDDTGLVLANGDFRLECQGRAATELELRPSGVSRGDGRVYGITLFGAKGPRSETLVPVTGEHPNPCTREIITYPAP